MSVEKIIQPEIINIDEQLRLRKFDNKHDFALAWYQDLETVRLVDGENAQAYDEKKLGNMYNYLSAKGELYFIEAKIDNEYLPIGDVTFWQYDMPIVIGDINYHGRGIGCKVIKTLTQRAKEIGYDKIYVNEIYSYNIASQRAFEKAGFQRHRETPKGYSYICELD